MYVEPNQNNYGAYGCEPSALSSSTPAPLNVCSASADLSSSSILRMYINSESPTIAPTNLLTDFPTEQPTEAPTAQPTIKDEPSAPPTDNPTALPTIPKVNYYGIVGTTLAAFSAVAVLNTLLIFYQPPQDTSSVSQTSLKQVEKSSEF